MARKLSCTVTSQCRIAARTVGATRSPSAVSTAASGWRRSMLKTTRPATLLELFGSTTSRPTVKRSTSAGSCNRAFSAVTARTMSCMASRRRPNGAVPACALAPVSVTLNQRLPWMPVTTPMASPAASSSGPCSICAST